MHNEFHELLADAEGDSELVVVVNADIREFTVFSERVESVEAALYVKKIYLRMLDDYFPDADFFKPTGDGLLILETYNEDSLEEVSNRVVRRSLSLLRELPDLLDDDPMVNFPTPRRIGIGIARGAASRLRSGGKTLEFSGRVLNLATRLMDIARPEGIVLDGAFRLDVLEKDVRTKFTEGSAYLRSIAEREPRLIYYTSDRTTIPRANTRPLDRPSWGETTFEWSTLQAMREAREAGPRFFVSLDEPPEDPGSIEGWVTAPMRTPGGRRSRRFEIRERLHATEFDYFEDAGKPIVSVDVASLADRLETEENFVRTWPVSLRFVYAEA